MSKCHAAISCPRCSKDVSALSAASRRPPSAQLSSILPASLSHLLLLNAVAACFYIPFLHNVTSWICCFDLPLAFSCFFLFLSFCLLSILPLCHLLSCFSSLLPSFFSLFLSFLNHSFFSHPPLPHASMFILSFYPLFSILFSLLLFSQLFHIFSLSLLHQGL